MNFLFKVKRKSTGKIVPVYAVKSEHYSVQFLIYDGGMWLYALAGEFEPA